MSKNHHNFLLTSHGIIPAAKLPASIFLQKIPVTQEDTFFTACGGMPCFICETNISTQGALKLHFVQHTLDKATFILFLSKLIIELN